MSDNLQKELRDAQGLVRVLQCRLALAEAQHALTDSLKGEIEKAIEEEREVFSNHYRNFADAVASQARDLEIAEGEVEDFKQFLIDKKLLHEWEEWNQEAF